jgi:L-2,4-diaminobutyrate decarboxylase
MPNTSQDTHHHSSKDSDISFATALEAARQRIATAYDPRLLNDAGHRLIDALAAHLERAQHSEGAVLPWADPGTAVHDAAEMLRQGGGSEEDVGAGRMGRARGGRNTRGDSGGAPADGLDGNPKSSGRGEPSRDDSPVDLPIHFAELVQEMLARGLNLHDPRYVGHQVPAPVPLGGLFDAVGSVTNQVMAIYEMGPWSTAVEQAMIRELGEAIGWPPGTFAGAVTHGGSLANLTALLTARNLAVPDAWERGLAGRGAPPVLLAHADAHYSVARAAGILGLGSRQIVRVGLDTRGRMDPKQLDGELTRLRAENRAIVAVTACACATPTGAFDPLEDIADVCAAHGVWLHVDAAHGGAAVLSERHRHLLAGLERADSVVWDAHKMLFVPSLCAFVFYRDARHRFEAFHQDAPYLFDPAAPGLAEYDSGMKTVECTKRAAAFGLWGVWTLFGRQLFADLVDVTFALGRTFYEKLRAAPDFVPLHEPQCNIAVFRHVPAALRGAGAEEIGDFQLELRRRVIESGEYYLVPAKYEGIGALRTTLINPLTTPAHLDGLLDTLRRQGRLILGG